MIRLLFLFCVASALAVAAPDTPASPTSADQVIVPRPAAAPTAPAGAPAVSGGMGALTLVAAVALAVAGGWLLWQKRSGNPIGRVGRHLAIEETRALGGRQYLVVATYQDKKFLLGVCPGRIEMLTPLHEPVEKPRA